LIFDFDGTLAPIVTLPSHAKLSVAVSRLLGKLCECAPVAIVSGRSVADLVDRIGVQPKYLVGNHGAEGLPDSHIMEDELRRVCAVWSHSLRTSLDDCGIDSGIMLEDKTFTLSLHYRLARDKNAALSILQNAIGKLDPVPKIIPGKCVINLLPQGALNKRLAVEQLLMLEGRKNALYVGDDDTDESVFIDAPNEWLTIRVEPEVQSKARFFLFSQAEVGKLLQIILSIHIERGFPF